MLLFIIILEQDVHVQERGDEELEPMSCRIL